VSPAHEPGDGDRGGPPWLTDEDSRPGLPLPPAPDLDARTWSQAPVGDGESRPVAERDPGPLDQRFVEAAVRRGLITAAQARDVLADAAGEDAVRAMVRLGLVTFEEADEVEAEVRSDFVPGFRVLEEIGRGGMGVVYLAIQQSLERRVALKVVTPRSALDPGLRQRFSQEARAMARLNHRNVVQVYDHGEVDGNVWIALELVEGCDCAALVRREGALGWERATRLVRDAALGLAHARAAGIVHRDIKPANLMLVPAASDARRGEEIVKVTDLGLARLSQGSSGEGSITEAGTVMGSPAYMSPEQGRGKPLDFRSDIYSLGATLYHLVVGRAPYSGSSALDILMRKQSDPPTSPREVVPHLGDGFLRVLDRMLARAPEDRYASYEALLDDLDAVLAGREPAARPLPPARAGLRLEEGPGSATARAATQSAVVSPGDGEAAESRAGVGGEEEEEEEEAGRPAPGAESAGGGRGRRRRRRAPAATAALVALLLLAAAGAAYLGAARPGAFDRADPPLEPPAVPTSALERELDAALTGLAALDPTARLEAAATLRQSRSALSRLPPTRRAALRDRLRGLLRDALRATADERRGRLESLWRAREYEALAAATDEARSRYAEAGQDLPARLAELAEYAAQARRDGAADREESAWSAARRAEDPLEQLRLLDDFAARFPFSPAREAAAALRSVAMERAPRVRIVTRPPAARLTLDGEPAGAGPWAGRLRAGEHVVRAEAPEHYARERSFAVAAGAAAELEVVLHPRPARRLVQDARRQRPVWIVRPGMSVGDLARSWDLEVGSWSPVPERAGLRSEGLANGEWSVARRDATPALRAVAGPDTPGWQLEWQLDPPPAGAAAEVRLLTAADGRSVVVGVTAEAVYVGVRRGGDLEVAGRLPFERAPGYYRADWDGDVFLVHAGAQRVASVRPGWTPQAEGRLRVAVRGGEAVFRSLSLFALRPADD